MTATTDTSPQNTVRLRREAEAHLRARRLPEAQQCCLAILREDRFHADAHFLLGVIAAELKRFGNAVEFMARAVELAPGQAEYHAQLARCLATLKRDREAAAAAARALDLGPTDSLTLDTIGVVLSRAGDQRRAAEAFRAAVAREPGNPGYQFNLAAALKFVGDFDGAEAAYEAAIARSPRFYKAHSSLSQLRRQSPERNHLARLEGLLRNGRHGTDGELHLRHALAKEYDDLGEYALAFEHLAAGNRRKRKEVDYSAADDEHLFNAVMETCDAGFMDSAGTGQPGSAPIFVLGMPRTGTTLVERILSAHSAVTSAGELQAFGIELKRLAGTPSNRVLDPATVAAARGLDFRVLGGAYLDASRPLAGLTPRFVDKMPLNFLYAGFIHRALPDAAIVCLRRHPLDTILSNFRQLFALNFSYYNYAYDLEDTARYYVLFHRLIEHWRRVLPPGRILELHYEDLVADQQGQSGRLLAHCGLGWEAQVLRFEQNDAPVATASAAQVREPLYSSAVHRWRRYENELGPAREILEAAGIPVP